MQPHECRSGSGRSGSVVTSYNQCRSGSGRSGSVVTSHNQCRSGSGRSGSVVTLYNGFQVVSHTKKKHAQEIH